MDSYSSESLFLLQCMKKVFTKRDTYGRIVCDLVQRSLYLQDAYEWGKMEMSVYMPLVMLPCSNMHHVYTHALGHSGYSSLLPIGVTQLYWMCGWPSWPNSFYSSCLHHIQLPFIIIVSLHTLDGYSLTPCFSSYSLTLYSQWLQSY